MKREVEEADRGLSVFTDRVSQSESELMAFHCVTFVPEQVGKELVLGLWPRECN